MATPPTISAHELVTPPVLRIARAAYAAPLRHDLTSERKRHHARLATAVAATAPYLIAGFLAPLRSYLDDCAFGHVAAASRERRTAGGTEFFHRHRAAGQAYDHAAELLEHHAVTFSGGDPRPTADLTAPGPPVPTPRARDIAEAEPAPMISPHDLVTIHMLRIARAGYAAPLRHDFDNPRHRHRARLSTAIAAAAPFVVAEFLPPLMNYLDMRFLPASLAAEEEHERAGHTPLYQHHHAVYSAYQDAATLLDRHHLQRPQLGPQGRGTHLQLALPLEPAGPDTEPPLCRGSATYAGDQPGSRDHADACLADRKGMNPISMVTRGGVR